MIMSVGYVPYAFRLSYTVPLPKAHSVSSTSVIDNHRAISISPIVSKIFERCILTSSSAIAERPRCRVGC